MTTLLMEVLEGQELTSRELEVLEWAAEGFTAQETGEQIHLSMETVKSYRKRAIAKLGARNLSGAMAIAFRRGLIR